MRPASRPAPLQDFPKKIRVVPDTPAGAGRLPSRIEQDPDSGTGKVREVSLLKTWIKQKPLQVAGAVAAFIGSVALIWFTIHAPERGKDPQVTAMESESAKFFAVERDITALAADAQSGAARSIGLSNQYALVNLQDGGRYYVRIDTQRALVGELLKDGLAMPVPAVFSLGDVEPPAPPLT